uniref:Ubiquitin-like domain-containing protein n=1 Tax=Ananas comosus var. bracteatus TaxID=296719 RepID=A0A6V7QD00_ANACO|nr:unnamed protein product [Ananas comosus var. bracteatus]
MADSVELPASVAELSNSNMQPWDSVGEPEFASEMEIVVQLGAVHNYVLLADGDNTVEDVLVEILGLNRAAQAPEPRLCFNDLELEKQKTLAEYGINLGSVLQLKCTPRVLAHSYDPTEIAKMNCAESSSSMRPDGDGEMKIFVQSEHYGNYALEVDSSNTIQDVLVTVLVSVLPTWQAATALYFNGQLLERGKSLADYSIEDGSILHLKRAALNFVPRGRVNMIAAGDGTGSGRGGRHRHRRGRAELRQVEHQGIKPQPDGAGELHHLPRPGPRPAAQHAPLRARMVSVGPYGRGDRPVLRAMEQHKWRYLQDFLSRNPYSRVDRPVLRAM